MKLSAAKTGLVAGMMASTFLLGACSSSTSDSARHPVPPPAVRIADRPSAWGDQPSYDAKGQYFYHMSRPFSHEYALNGITILELMVNRDGTVQKMAVVSTSGDISTDRMALSMYWHARYSLSLGPDDPAPYVVRETVVFKGAATAKAKKGSTYGPTYYSGPDYETTDTPQYQNPGNSNTVNGFVR